MTKYLFVFLLILFTGTAHSDSGVIPTLFSPDTKVNLKFALDRDGTPIYEVYKNDQPMLKPSRLGFAIKKQKPLMQFRLLSHHLRAHDRRWQAVWGERKAHRDHYNELFVALQERGGERLLNVRFRAFDDGVAFRYEFPEQSALEDFVITDELTEFVFADNYDTWWLEANYDSYEKLYRNTPLNDSLHVNTPVTLTSKDGVHLSVHEAALTNYPSMTLKRSATNTYTAELVPWADGDKVKARAPMVSPWRTLQLSDDAAGLANSTMIVNLNEPNVLADTSWIRPMTYIGIWWGIHIGVHTWTVGERHGATTERAMEYIDFAAANNIGGVLIEGWNKGWEQWGERDAYVVPAEDFDLEKVAAYARKKGVRLVGHNETGGNVEAYERHADEIFALYASLGITTVKTGYVAEQGLANGEHHQGQWGVNHYRRIVQLAAKHRIMINVHEPIKDTGIRRTYPNMMTREGARGGEWNAWSEGNPPEHTLILPFTRLLGGPMDYTPGIFDIDFSNFSGKRFDGAGKPQTGNYRVHTTLARQLADMVILYSPLQMAADLVENYRGHPAFEFIRHLNVDFDESFVRDAKIGEAITVVRRAGDVWYIGSSTDHNARSMSLNLDFLAPGKKYRARLFVDAADAHWQKNPEAYIIDSAVVDATSTLSVALAPGGGAAIYLAPL